MPAVGEVDRRKIERPGVPVSEVAVALVEGRVDGIAEQQCPRELELIFVDVDLDVCRKRVGPVAHAPQFHRNAIRTEARREDVSMKRAHDSCQVDHAVGWLHLLRGYRGPKWNEGSSGSRTS